MNRPAGSISLITQIMKAIITRKIHQDKQTLGELVLLDDSENTLFTCKTLELAWKNNEKGKSCIPAGNYKVVPRYTAKRGKHFLVTGTTPRQLILFHSGNYHTETEGCIIVGKAFSDLNKDGYLDVINSRSTLKKLVELAPKGFELKITNQ